MAKGKSFKSNTGYPVTVGFMDQSGNPREIRVDHETAYETSDQAELDALAGSPEVAETKGSSKDKSDG